MSSPFLPSNGSQVTSTPSRDISASVTASDRTGLAPTSSTSGPAPPQFVLDAIMFTCGDRIVMAVSCIIQRLAGVALHREPCLCRRTSLGLGRRRFACWFCAGTLCVNCISPVCLTLVTLYAPTYAQLGGVSRKCHPPAGSSAGGKF